MIVAVNSQLTDRFWNKVNKNGPTSPHKPELGPCWIWTGSVAAKRPSCPTGYGRFLVSGKVYQAHRLSFVNSGKKILEGLQIDHLCRTPLCVNPDHMEAVTSMVNTQRNNSPQGINYRKTHCVRGHEFNRDNSILTGGGRDCRKCKHIHYLNRMDRRSKQISVAVAKARLEEAKLIASCEWGCMAVSEDTEIAKRFFAKHIAELEAALATDATERNRS